MSRAVVLAAALLVSGAPPPSIDFGSVQLGAAALHVLRVPALGIDVSGVGFSATRTRGGVLIAFEPYELGEQVKGVLTLSTPSGLVRVALRGHGVDTIPPTVTVETPRAATAGRPLAIEFTATDNDLVDSCVLEVDGRVAGRIPWPASTFHWRVPAVARAAVRVTVVAVDRAGNRGAATSRAFPIR